MAYERRAVTVFETVAKLGASRGPDTPHYATCLDRPYLYKWYRGDTTTTDDFNVVGHTGGTTGRWKRVGGGGAIFYTPTQIDDGDSPYNVLATDYLIEVDVSSAAVAVGLPQASTYENMVVWIVDVSYNANTFNITVGSFLGDTVENSGSGYKITADGGYAVFKSRGSANDWKRIG